MDQLTELQRQRRTRKSISEVKEPTRQMSPLKLSIHPDNPLDGVLYNRQFKRSIIKINKKKLPVDFFSGELPEPLHRLNLERKLSVNRQQRLAYPATERKLHIDRLIDKLDNINAPSEVPEEGKFNGTSFFGGGSTTEVATHFRRENLHLKESDQARKVQRNYQTRSEEKREKPFLQQRKFTAVGASKPDSLDLFPYANKERGDSDIGDMVVFNGTFAREMRQQSGKTTALKQSAVQRADRKLDFQGLKFDPMNLKVSLLGGRQVDPGSLLTSMRREQKDPNEPSSPTREIGSPGRRGLQSPTKKQPISPVKIIVTSTQPRRAQCTPQGNGPANGQFFDVTFYNTKSSVLPPISK